MVDVDEEGRPATSRPLDVEDDIGAEVVIGRHEMRPADAQFAKVPQPQGHRLPSVGELLVDVIDDLWVRHENGEGRQRCGRLGEVDADEGLDEACEPDA